MCLRGNESMEPFEYNNYLFKRIIGRGSFSTVFEVESIQYSETFAAKVTPMCQTQISDDGELFDPEIAALIELDDPGIIRIYNYFNMNNFLVLILEYCPSGSLLDLIENRKLNEVTMKEMLYSITKSLKLCHSHSISHRDIKPSNIFIDSYGRPKLGDFGLSSFTSNFVHNVCGSVAFAAPEITKQDPYDAFAADIFALGITFFQVATGMLPCEDYRTENCVISERLLKKVENTEMDSLIRRMTNFSPLQRPLIGEVFEDTYFSGGKQVCKAKEGNYDRSYSHVSQLPSLMREQYNRTSTTTIPIFHNMAKKIKYPISMFPRRCKSLSVYDFPNAMNLTKH